MKAIQLLLSLSILVLLHEMGHFLAARAFKTRVEKFYLFFDFMFPFPNLLNFAFFKKKFGDTEYGIGWFPLGGYVKIAGMVDESTDVSELQRPPQPDEYRSKTKWQKLIIMLGGVMMNVLLGWLIYSQLLYWEGETYLPAEKAKYGVACDSLALALGFRNGDIILSHDGGIKFQNFNTIGKELLLDNIKTIEVLRDGQPVIVTIPDNFVAQAVNRPRPSSGSSALFDFQIPCMVGDFSSESVIKGKLQKGDIITAINDIPVKYFSDARPILASLKGQAARVAFLHQGQAKEVTVTVPASGLLGFRAPTELKAYKGYLDFVEVKYGLLESFGVGAIKAYEKMRDYLKQFKIIFSPSAKGYKQLGGVGTMASLFPETWDWYTFFNLTAFLSLILAVVNLLPIPMLDGGYVILLLFEILTGKDLSDRAIENINKVGLVFLLGLMIFANGNDLWRMFISKFFH